MAEQEPRLVCTLLEPDQPIKRKRRPRKKRADMTPSQKHARNQANYRRRARKRAAARAEKESG